VRATVSDERFPRQRSLRRSADYQQCYRAGARRQGTLATLHVRANGVATPRLGLTASRKVGGAVVRNRLKRWTRESFRRWPRRGELPAADLVVHFKPAAAAATHAELAGELTRLWSRLVDERPGHRP